MWSVGPFQIVSVSQVSSISMSSYYRWQAAKEMKEARGKGAILLGDEGLGFGSTSFESFICA